MKTWWLIFVLLLLACLLVGGVLLTSEPAGWHGVAHPEFDPMQQSIGASRHDGWLLTGWLFGVLQFVLFLTILTLGLRPENRRGAGMFAIIVLGFAVIATFSIVLVTYASRMHDETGPLVLGLPVSTALMLYALWPMPTSLVALYVVMFDRWILRKDELAAFFQRVKQHGGSLPQQPERWDA